MLSACLAHAETHNTLTSRAVANAHALPEPNLGIAAHVYGRPMAGSDLEGQLCREQATAERALSQELAQVCIPPSMMQEPRRDPDDQLLLRAHRGCIMLLGTVCPADKGTCFSGLSLAPHHFRRHSPCRRLRFAAVGHSLCYAALCS